MWSYCIKEYFFIKMIFFFKYKAFFWNSIDSWWWKVKNFKCTHDNSNTSDWCRSLTKVIYIVSKKIVTYIILSIVTLNNININNIYNCMTGFMWAASVLNWKKIQSGKLSCHSDQSSPSICLGIPLRRNTRASPLLNTRYPKPRNLLWSKWTVSWSVAATSR